MSQSTSDERPPGLANAQVTGGGGHEPTLDESGPDGTRARVPAAGSGVDMKTDSLGDAED
jgi:hypothetical protein